MQTKLIYARPGGDDANGDGSLAAPYATLTRALMSMRELAYGNELAFGDKRVLIDITGVQEIITEQLQFPIIHAPGQSYLDVTKTGVLNQWNAPFAVQAVPITIDEFDITSQTSDPVTNLKTLEDASAAWEVDEHKGRIALGAGFLQMGVIASNTATTIEITSNFPFTGPVKILEPSAEITFAYARPSAGVLIQPQTQMVVSGVSFRNTDPASYNVGAWVAGASQCVFVGCRFEGIYTESHVLSDACWFHGTNKEHYVAGDEHRARFCLFSNQKLRIYGTGARGTQGPYACILDGCTSAGHGGNNESHSSYEIVSCYIRNSVGAGILFQGGSRCSVRTTRIDNSSSAGVTVRGPGVLDLISVTGQGNNGYGVHLEQGGCINTAGVVDLQGTSGDVDLGGKGLTTWAETPTSDAASLNPKGCYVYRS